MLSTIPSEAFYFILFLMSIIAVVVSVLWKQSGKMSSLQSVAYFDPITQMMNEEYLDKRVIPELFHQAKTEVEAQDDPGNNGIIFFLFGIENLEQLEGDDKNHLILRTIARNLMDYLQSGERCFILDDSKFLVILPSANEYKRLLSAIKMFSLHIGKLYDLTAKIDQPKLMTWATIAEKDEEWLFDRLLSIKEQPLKKSGGWWPFCFSGKKKVPLSAPAVQDV
jgi:GGDEF domain-containing protein